MAYPSLASCRDVSHSYLPYHTTDTIHYISSNQNVKDQVRDRRPLETINFNLFHKFPLEIIPTVYSVFHQEIEFVYVTFVELTET